MALSSIPFPLKVCIVGPEPMLRSVQEGIGLLGHLATAGDPRFSSSDFLNAHVDLLIVLLREDLEEAVERWEPIFPPGVEMLFDEAEHREAWNAQRWAQHFQTKLSQLALKKAPAFVTPTPSIAPITVSPSPSEELNGGFDFYDETGVDGMVLIGSSEGSPRSSAPVVLSLAPMSLPEETPALPSRVSPPVVAWSLEGQNTSSPPAGEERSAVIVVVAGTGGPAALLSLVEHLPHNLAAAVVIFQDLPQGRHNVLASNLQKRTPLPVGLSKTNTPLTAGEVTLALPSHELFDQEHWQVREGSPVQSAALLGENDALVLLSGTSGEWLIPAMEAVSRGALLLGQRPAEAVEAHVISALSETGLVAETMEAIGQHLADRWAGSMG